MDANELDEAQFVEKFGTFPELLSVASFTMSYSCQTTIIVGKIKSQQSPAELPVNWTLDQS